MKKGLAILGMGAFAIVLQGAVAGFLSPPWCPDLGFLIVIALGPRFASSAGGISIAATLGYLSDLLSGSLLGQHLLLRMLAFGAARRAGRRLDLRGLLPQAVFAGSLSGLNALAFAVVTAFFAGSGFGWPAPRAFLTHVAVDAAFAPLVAAAVDRVLAWAGEDDSSRPLMRFEPRGKIA